MLDVEVDNQKLLEDIVDSRNLMARYRVAGDDCLAAFTNFSSGHCGKLISGHQVSHFDPKRFHKLNSSFCRLSLQLNKISH